MINNQVTNLQVYGNYRRIENNFSKNEESLNSRIIFNQKIFNNFVNLKTHYETSSGTVASQEYLYIKTAPGMGYYTWIGYNTDGIQDFDEFEVAEFQDQANYLRVPKPNDRFIATQRAKLRQGVKLDFKQWTDKKGTNQPLSHFSNESFLNISNE
ncbi:hypothetical protein PI23P_05762 [Polaribacter irgensii 23-P]|uniref:Uncharacterized protein n=1 Tax=Polaribacter irgensii 23-P TaxID=313594 RepID=A4BYD9_9FLAO|nr:hypothetical protein [Polaribacter irgensii]EAR13980.1 hypothetical protein PI23P_05762 [Polaribacter irgensii 23-P]